MNEIATIKMLLKLVIWCFNYCIMEELETHQNYDISTTKNLQLLRKGSYQKNYHYQKLQPRIIDGQCIYRYSRL